MTVNVKNNRDETLSGSITFTGGVSITTTGVQLTDVNVALGTATGTKLGTATTQKLAFHNSTPVVQRAGAAQAAVATDAATSTTPFGYSEAQANAIVALVNELRAVLVEKGLMKGSA